MAEKKEITYVAGDNPYIGEKWIVTNIGAHRGADTVFEIYWKVPSSDEESQDRYGCDLIDLVEAGVRQLSTRPDYKTVGFEDDGSLKDGGHEAMQALADGYKPGQRVAATGGVKAKAKKLDSITEKYGEGSMDTLEAKLAKLKELEEKGLI